MKKIVIALMTVFTLSLASVAYAADNGTEFGIEDDLTVFGKAGNAVDPDVEIKGFTVFGATQTAYLIPVDTGNVVLNGVVQISSGLYVAGNSTFSATAFFTGISSFSNVANIHIAGGEAGQVLKKVAGGGMQWLNDSVGLDADAMGDPRYLQMPNAGETALLNTLLYQNVGDGGITLLGLSSMTVTGALGVHGASKFNGAVTLSTNTGIAGALTLYDNLSVSSNAVVGGRLGVASDLKVNNTMFTVDGTNGNTGIAGTLGVTGASSLSTLGTSGLATLNSASVTTTLGVTGAATLSDNLTVNGNAKLGDAVTDIHGVNVAPETDVALAVKGDGTAASGKYVAKFYSGASLAAWIKTK